MHHFKDCLSFFSVYLRLNKYLPWYQVPLMQLPCGWFQDLFSYCSWVFKVCWINASAALDKINNNRIYTMIWICVQISINCTEDSDFKCISNSKYYLQYTWLLWKHSFGLVTFQFEIWKKLFKTRYLNKSKQTTSSTLYK